MSGIRAICGIMLLSGSLCLAATSPAQSTKHTVSHKHAAKPQPAVVQPALPALPPGPLTPLTLEQTPAAPPQVGYHGGVLTIDAQNSTLGEILRAVHTQTGAIIDVSGNASDRVVGRFGPGPARAVMADLLKGSRFNYVMLGSAADSNALQRLVLSPKPASASVASAAGQQPAPNNPYLNGPNPNNPYAGRRVDNFNNNTADQADDDDDAQSNTIPDNQEAPDTSGQPAIKTPDQLLQELQRQQQIQQQQIQQQQQQQSPQDAPPQPPRDR